MSLFIHFCSKKSGSSAQFFGPESTGSLLLGCFLRCEKNFNTFIPTFFATGDFQLVLKVCIFSPIFSTCLKRSVIRLLRACTVHAGSFHTLQVSIPDQYFKYKIWIELAMIWDGFISVLSDMMLIDQNHKSL